VTAPTLRLRLTLSAIVVAVIALAGAVADRVGGHAAAGGVFAGVVVAFVLAAVIERAVRAPAPARPIRVGDRYAAVQAACDDAIRAHEAFERALDLLRSEP
jgi:hypothetical protein